MTKVHSKKAFKSIFDLVVSGEKTFDMRLADWKCEEGDILELVEIGDEEGEPTGRTLRCKIGAVLRTKDIEQAGWWSKEDIEKHGFQVMSLVNISGPGPEEE